MQRGLLLPCTALCCGFSAHSLELGTTRILPVAFPKRHLHSTLRDASPNPPHPLHCEQASVLAQTLESSLGCCHLMAETTFIDLQACIQVPKAKSIFYSWEWQMLTSSMIKLTSFSSTLRAQCSSKAQHAFLPCSFLSLTGTHASKKQDTQDLAMLQQTQQNLAVRNHPCRTCER